MILNIMIWIINMNRNFLSDKFNQVFWGKETRVPSSKNICVTFLTLFLLLHRNSIRTKCTNLSNEISSKVFLVFCVCLLFVDDFFALFYFISCHNMLLLKAIQSNWAKILQWQQAVGFVDKLSSIYSLELKLIVIVT